MKLYGVVMYGDHVHNFHMQCVDIHAQCIIPSFLLTCECVGVFTITS